jgi:outer membrane receptor protein involved in Fe transport
VVFNLGAEYRIGERFALFAQVDNLLDQRFYTSAQIASTAVTPAGTIDARPFAGPVVDGERPIRGSTFYGPGAPRLVRVGLRYRLN